jgi:hypothetical protein
MLSRNKIRSWFIQKIALLEKKAEDCAQWTHNDLIVIVLGVKDGGNLYFESLVSSKDPNEPKHRIEAYLRQTSLTCMCLLEDTYYPEKAGPASENYAYGEDSLLPECQICIVVGALRQDYPEKFKEFTKIVMPSYEWK